MRKLQLTGGCAVLFVFALVAHAAEDADPVADSTLEEVLVAGEYPGPGLWRVSKDADDGEHVLWIFGTLAPIPAEIKWKSRQVEKIAAESQEIIVSDGVRVQAEKKVGMFTAMTLVPAVLRARKNPDGKTLKDVLPADVYERWVVQKAKYIGTDSGIETWRPVFVADELRQKAIRKMKRPFNGGSWAVIGPIAREHKIKVTFPVVAAKIPNDQIRSSLKSFSKMPLQDAECLDVTMKLVDALSDEKAVNTRAAAWATGNLMALRELPEFPKTEGPCFTALVQSDAVKDLHLQGLDDLDATRAQKWLEVAENALASNRSTLALLPIGEVLKEDGRLAKLREKGYRVEDPI